MFGMAARRLVVFMVCVSFTMGLVPVAQARVIGTQTLLEQTLRQERIDKVNALLAREDVRKQLVAMGVDPQAAQERVANLTDDELQLLEQRIDSLPAGGEVLVIVGIVFVVLLILELLGVTNFFTSI